MGLRLYNSRTRSTQPFVTHEPGHARIYVCGLTPSAQAHLGHARSFLFFDVLRRYLQHTGYNVTYVQNVTDIDDRSIAAAQKLGRAYSDVVEEYYAGFTASMRKLGVAPPDKEPRATKHLPDIIAMIGALIERGNAYVAEDAVYFRVSTFPRYGELAGRNVEDLLVGARVAAGEFKDDPLDFALWKFARPGEPAWPTPWGAGRPGWHIECSAMSQAILGLPIDIHGGGMDLIFPHHENEIAQTESLFPPPMANFWIHGGLLLFEGKKMSKSLGNFEPMSDILVRHDPQALRLLFLQTGYRKPMNFTEDAVLGAAAGLKRLRDAAALLRDASLATVATAVNASPIVNTVEESPGDGPGIRKANAQPPAADPASAAKIKEYENRLLGALDDDINTSAALSVLFDMASESRNLIETGASGAALACMCMGMELLGIPLSLDAGNTGANSLPPTFSATIIAAIATAGEPPVEGLAQESTPEDAVGAILSARKEARTAKNFGRSDRLRDVLAAAGVIVKDDRSGSTWSIS